MRRQIRVFLGLIPEHEYPAALSRGLESSRVFQGFQPGSVLGMSAE